MWDHADEWLEQRMRWKLSRSPSVFSSVYLFSENAYRFPAALASCDSIENLGIPVFAILGTDSWSLFGTNKIVSYYHGDLVEVEYDSICDMDYPQAGSLPKDEQDVIDIKNRYGQIKTIWTGPGGTFAWAAGLLLMLQRMQKTNEN